MIIPKLFLKKSVMTPLRPNSKIQEYAPIKGADIDEMMINIRNRPFPLISYRVNMYAKGVPMINVKTVTAVVTLKLFQSVLK